MAKKKDEMIVPVRNDWMPPLSEERRKILFPNSPPPNWKQLKEMKIKKNHEKN